jgi:hypothetical protein
MPANASCATLTTTDPRDGTSVLISKERASMASIKYLYVTIRYADGAKSGTVLRAFAFCPAARFAVYISSKHG